MDRPMEKDSFWDLHRRLAECYMSDVAMSPMILGQGRAPWARVPGWGYLGGVQGLPRSVVDSCGGSPTLHREE